MPELVPHKGQVAVTSSAEGNQSDNLMQGYGAIYNKALIANPHAPVHLLISKPEHNGLIAN